ncbi:ATP-dependent metallopeptidase FtsH/Yme1/Tma family protein [Clostridium perfringens]
MKAKPKKYKYLILTILVLFICISCSFTFNHIRNKSTEEISYSKFIEMVDKGDIKEVIFNKKNLTFKAISNDNKFFKVPNPNYDEFKKDMLLKNIKIGEALDISSSLYTLLTILLFIILIANMLKKHLTKISVSLKPLNKNIDVISTNKPNVKFDDIAGNKEIKEEMKEIVDFLKHPQKYLERNVKLPKGIILTGPPGTGKTLLAKAIANESNVPFIYSNGSDFMEKYVGVGASRIRNMFENARKNAPCILFIDEIDAIGGKRSSDSNDGERLQTINALLTEMDGFNSSDGVLVISATNRLDMLDSALTRSGRFDKHLTIPLPEQNDRLEILRQYAKGKPLSEEISLDILSKELIGFSGADIANLLNEANFLSVSKNKDIIDKEDLDDAFFKMVMKGHKKPITKDEEEVKLIAWHETGHALVNLLSPKGDDVNKVTIIPSSSGAGGVTITTPKKLGLYSKKYIETQIKSCYGGRIGEYLLLGTYDEITTGASQDIKTATNLIKDYISAYGMDDEYGMLNLNVLGCKDSEISERAKNMAKRLYEETFDLLSSNKHLLEAIADKLIEKETLTGEELINMIKEIDKEIQ